MELLTTIKTRLYNAAGWGLVLCAVLTLLITGQEDSQAQARPPAGDTVADKARAMEVIGRYCVSCHGPDKQKGEVRLDDFDLIDAVALQNVFVKAREAVHFDEMPPAKAKQPTAEERTVLLDWLGEQLNGTAAAKLEEKLQRPESGNYVNHDDLFSGKYAELQPFTYDRRWLISDYIFDEKFHRIFADQHLERVDGKPQQIAGIRQHPVKLTNPFGPDESGGLRYYANQMLDAGQVQTMLANARLASAYMMSLAKQKGDYLPAINTLLELQYKHESMYQTRKRFLEDHIDRVLQDAFGDRHEQMLPTFAPADRPEPVDTPRDATQKAKFHAATPGSEELGVVYRTLKKYKDQGLSEEAMLDAAEREWFYYGDDSAVIQRRITFYKNYTQEFWKRADENSKYGRYATELTYKPLGDAEMRVVYEAVRKHREQGYTYKQVIAKCLNTWERGFAEEIQQQGPPPDAQVLALVEQLFDKIYERSPFDAEAEQYTVLASRYMTSLGTGEGINRLIQTLMMKGEFVYRHEFGAGEADEYGRRMMSPRDASYAIAYALTDSSPDAALVKAAEEGRLNTRADYEREVKRILSQRDQYYLIDDAVHGGQNVFNITNMPIRELRFFREFFAYPKMMSLFKDDKRFGGLYSRTTARVVAEADRLVEHYLEKDADVFNQLLTTDSFYVYHSGDNQAMAQAVAQMRAINNYFKDKDWRNYTFEDLLEHQPFIAQAGILRVTIDKVQPQKQKQVLRDFMDEVDSITQRFASGHDSAAPYSHDPTGGNNAQTRGGVGLRMPGVAKLYNIDLLNWDYPTTQPAPIKHRKGMLTHPAWLIAFSHNTETDPIRRGKWIQNRLLAGTVPDVPITVDAVVPEDPHKTLRQRMEVKTGQAYCWTCHLKMEPLGLPFEIYDDFGRYRTEEQLEYPENLITKVKDKGQWHEDLRDLYKSLPVHSTGYLEGSGSSDLDGEVKDALDLIDRLAKSDRVRQSIIRHTFRYFMGRNEMLSDSKTLIDADRAYLESGGSFDALIVSLLISDSFIYRKDIPAKE